MNEDGAAEPQEHEFPELVIRSEQDAWEALEHAISGGRFPADLRIRFDGWPTFELNIKGKDWHSTVPTRVMPALLDVQRDLHRAFANIQYNEPNLRRLREEERDDLEIVVKVNEGSSEYNADLWEQFTRLAEAAVTRMNGTEAVIAVIGVALTIMAPVMFKVWLNARGKEKDSSVRVELSKEETERVRIITAAMKQQPIIAVARDDAEATSNKLLKATKPGDEVGIAGVQISAEQAQQIVQPERARSEELQLDGLFSILGNRTDKGKGFRITVRRDTDQLTLNADVPIELAYDQQQIIQNAEWSKMKVRLWIEAEILRDSITRAVITKAAAAKDDADGEPTG